MLTAIYREANENILDVVLTNNDLLTRQIIITETSMSDHNIIQIETNIRIVEEKQNHQIKESNLSYWDLNFFNEDISWTSIDADLFNTSWDMLLADVKTDEMYKIIINICLKICKKIWSAKEKFKKTPNTQWQKGYDEKNIKITKENTEVNRSSNPRKCTKSNNKNLKELKNFNQHRKKSKRNESYCCYQEKSKILQQILKK